MGFNSVIHICNDCVGDIEKDPVGWWKKAWSNLCIPGRGDVFGNAKGKFGFGSSCNGFQAVWNEHADSIGLIAVGGNYATVLYTSYDPRMSHHIPGDQVRLLRQWANKLGYNISKKRKKKEKTAGVRLCGRWNEKKERCTLLKDHIDDCRYEALNAKA